MKKETFRNKLFRLFGKVLANAGANKGNTKIKKVGGPKVPMGREITYLGRLRGRLVHLVVKAGGLAFVILVTIAPMVKEAAPMLVPADNKPSMIAPQTSQLWIGDFAKFPASGTMQLYVSEFGISPPASTPREAATYDIQPGDKLVFVPRTYQPPQNYVSMISGSYLG